MESSKFNFLVIVFNGRQRNLLPIQLYMPSCSSITSIRKQRVLIERKNTFFVVFNITNEIFEKRNESNKGNVISTMFWEICTWIFNGRIPCFYSRDGMGNVKEMSIDEKVSMNRTYR